MSSYKLTGKIVIRASFKTISPFVIGKGKSLSEEADCDVMTINKGNPYIPSSSFAGKLKTFIKANQSQPTNGLYEYFWGTEKTDLQSNSQEYQSHLNMEDVLTFDKSSFNKIVIRDGVRIDYEKGTARPGAKYDYQVVEPELHFNIQAEITIREGADFEKIKNSVTQIYAALKHTDFRIGALTNHGLGKIELTNFKAWHFDFIKQKNSADWFNYLEDLHKIKEININYFKVEPKDSVTKLPLNHEGILTNNSFRIRADFKLKRSIIIGTYGTLQNEADKKHIRSNGKAVITGKSIRGAFQNRAHKIINTIKGNLNTINTLFGEVGETDRTKTKKGKLRIDEIIIEKSSKHEQNRIKIDRFTQGTMSGALFNSESVETADNLKFEFVIRNPEPQEKALLLLLLRDLWTEDLAIGGEKNIGRGIVTGISGSITDEGNIIELGKSGIQKENSKIFDTYINSLTN